MLNPSRVLIEAFVPALRAGFQDTYGGLNPDYAEIIAWVGNMALENIANSNALYHNVEHTVFVTLVGQEILRGKHIREGRVSCEDWLHFIISLLCHDIGYVKGVCRRDRPRDRGGAAEPRPGGGRAVDEHAVLVVGPGHRRQQQRRRTRPRRESPHPHLATPRCQHRQPRPIPET